jgi:hypothetical protein
MHSYFKTKVHKKPIKYINFHRLLIINTPDTLNTFLFNQCTFYSILFYFVIAHELKTNHGLFVYNISDRFIQSVNKYFIIIIIIIYYYYYLHKVINQNLPIYTFQIHHNTLSNNYDYS